MGGVSPDEMRAAQILTGAVLALWLAIGYVPALRRYAVAARLALLVVYLVGCVGVFLHAVLR